MDWVERGAIWLCRLLNYAAALGALAILGLVIAGVTMRYVFNDPLGFTEELVGLLLISIVFLTVPLGLLSGRSIHVSLVTQLLPPLGRRIAQILASLVVIAFAGWYVWVAYDKWLALAFRLDLKTEVARLPLTPWMVLVPAMLAVAAAVAVYQIVRVLTGRPAGISARQAGLPDDGMGDGA